MLTRISIVTGLLILLVQGLVLFGVNLSSDQQAWITSFITAAGAAAHGWYNPSFKKVGKTA